MIKTQRITATSSGSAGVATGNENSDRPVTGEILAVYVNYTGQPVTCDIILKTVGPVSYEVLSIADNATDGWYHPQAQAVDKDNSAFTNGHVPFVLADYLNLAIAQGDDAGTVEVTVFYEG